MHIPNLHFTLSSILILFLLNGCASSILSVKEGRAKFSIPFDFPKSQKQELQKEKTAEKREKSKAETNPKDKFE